MFLPRLKALLSAGLPSAALFLGLAAPAAADPLVFNMPKASWQRTVKGTEVLFDCTRPSCGPPARIGAVPVTIRKYREEELKSDKGLKAVIDEQAGAFRKMGFGEITIAYRKRLATADYTGARFGGRVAAPNGNSAYFSAILLVQGETARMAVSVASTEAAAGANMDTLLKHADLKRP